MRHLPLSPRLELLAAGQPLLAQASSASTPSSAPEDRAQEFVPTQGGADSVSAPSLLIAAYVAMWALLLGFVVLGWLRQRGLDDRLARLEGAVPKDLPTEADSGAVDEA